MKNVGITGTGILGPAGVNGPDNHNWAGAQSDAGVCHDGDGATMLATEVREEVVTSRPYGNRVIIKPIPVAERTAAGIYVPDTAKEKPQIGLVMRVGRECVETSEGDYVLYGKFGGTDIKLIEGEYVTMRETDIYCQVPQPPETVGI